VENEVETWQQVTAAALAVLASVGGGLRWFLVWLFKELDRIRSEYRAALELSQQQFLAKLDERESRLEAEREARLRDRDEHVAMLREINESFNRALVQLRNSRPPTSSTRT